MAVDSQDSVLVVGYSYQGFPGTRNDVAVARLETTGMLDVGFGTHGQVLTDIGQSSDDYGYDTVAYQSDGKVLLSSQDRTLISP